MLRAPNVIARFVGLAQVDNAVPPYAKCALHFEFETAVARVERAGNIGRCQSSDNNEGKRLGGKLGNNERISYILGYTAKKFGELTYKLRLVR